LTAQMLDEGRRCIGQGNLMAAFNQVLGDLSRPAPGLEDAR
jgi:hypothetical protein